MSDNNKRVLHVTCPVTMTIGPVPQEVKSASELFTFGLSNLRHLLNENGLQNARMEGKHANIIYADGVKQAVSFNHLGQDLDSRAYMLQPTAAGKHELSFSTDGGDSFKLVAVFEDEAFARAFGDAWTEGRAEAEA